MSFRNEKFTPLRKGPLRGIDREERRRRRRGERLKGIKGLRLQDKEWPLGEDGRLGEFSRRGREFDEAEEPAPTERIVIDYPPTPSRNNQQQQHRSDPSATTAPVTKTIADSGSKESSGFKDDLDPYYNAVIEDLDTGNHFSLLLLFLSFVILYETIRCGLRTTTHRIRSKSWRNKFKTDEDDTDTASRLQSGQNTGNTRQRRRLGARYY
jgi:hypothetical protein